MDIVLCGLVIHIADARMNEYGERVLLPFVGAPENHSAMSLSNEVCRKVGSWSAMVDELYHFGALSLSLSFLILQPSNHGFLKLAAKLGAYLEVPMILGLHF